MGSIVVVNDVVVSTNLTPAHVPPVSGVVVHVAEEARSRTARAYEGRPGISVGVGNAAVSRAVDLVVSVAPAAGNAAIAAVFVHACDVHVAGNFVGGDLDIADEGIVDIDRRGASAAAIGGEGGANLLVLAEVVPRYVHPAKERRGWIVVSVSGLPVVTDAGVNAKMSPAIRVRGSSGFVSAQRAACVSVDPDG